MRSEPTRSPRRCWCGRSSCSRRTSWRLLRESGQKRPQDADLFHLRMACKQLKQAQDARTALDELKQG